MDPLDKKCMMREREKERERERERRGGERERERENHRLPIYIVQCINIECTNIFESTCMCIHMYMY